MSAPRFTRLPRAVVAVAGEDCRAFLQGLISNDVNKAGPGRAVFAALLTPQGKFLHDLFVVATDGGLLLDVEAARAADFVRKLSMYKLRSKVTVAPADSLSVFAVFGGDVPPLADATVFADPRLPELGSRVYAADGAVLTAAGLAEAPFAEWDRLRLRLGVPDGSRDLPVEKGILLENGFDELGGVDFTKGCYMGQELTARTKHRGLVRKRLLPVAISGPVPEPGTPVMLGEAEAGEMRSAEGDVGVALLRLEQVRKGQPFTCGAATLTASVPAWAALPEGE
ncbi:folate-binding protein YgfZ [Magnetospirillum sp. UT-4]|uniref:CAF17-like 4Fe-4S cluster assembly/insertion protein YgfZ n=1 Tax=Magnetospirillum sp. UT-4 TaxID=2681467 RepID=UPI00137F31F9|nr:folate-binding protein YgfZ [Magnetospirillum sp. UT-4]CAA7619900.1 putative aminomethyltransferase folate-binding domain [Magnetospirillum sp. UT-4]